MSVAQHRHALRELYGKPATHRLVGLGWSSGRPVAYLSSCASCEGTPRAVGITHSNQIELRGLSAAEREEVQRFLTDGATPKGAA